MKDALFHLPLMPYEQISPWVNLVLALVIGIGFGFVLERGGLGNAKKLIGQFLLKDLTVFKVMFTAILTAMVGLFFLSSLGLVNLTLISHSDSYLLPQAIGGLLLGVGFAISGYCPGTTIVGIASGKRDALFCLGGIVVGTALFAVFFDWNILGITDLYHSTHLAIDSLVALFSVQYGLLVFVIIITALICFYLAEKLEDASNTVANTTANPKLKK